MLQVTTEANEKLEEYLKINAIASALRVALMQGGCSGPSLGLALDDEKPGDASFEKNNLVFLIEKSLLEQCGSITVDYVDVGQRSGFSIISEKPLPGGGGCSSGSCGSQGCGC